MASKWWKDAKIWFKCNFHTGTIDPNLTKSKRKPKKNKELWPYFDQNFGILFHYLQRRTKNIKILNKKHQWRNSQISSDSILISNKGFKMVTTFSKGTISDQKVTTLAKVSLQLFFLNSFKKYMIKTTFSLRSANWIKIFYFLMCSTDFIYRFTEIIQFSRSGNFSNITKRPQLHENCLK